MLERLPRDDHHLTRFNHARRDKDAEAGDEIELTDETAGTVPGDDAVGAVCMHDDLNRA